MGLFSFLTRKAPSPRDPVNIASPEFKANPYPFYARLRAEAPLARLEGQIAIGTLLRRVPDLRLNVVSDALRWRSGLILRGLESLPVAFGKHGDKGAGQGVSTSGISSIRSA